MDTETLQALFIIATTMITLMLVVLALVIVIAYLKVHRWLRMLDRAFMSFVPGPRRFSDLAKPRYTQDQFKEFDDGR